MKQFLATIFLLAALIGAVQAPTPAIASDQQLCSSNGHTSNMSRTIYLGQSLNIDLRYEQCHWLSNLWHDYEVSKVSGPPYAYATYGYYGTFTFLPAYRGDHRYLVCYEESSGHWYEADDEYCFYFTVRVV